MHEQTHAVRNTLPGAGLLFLGLALLTHLDGLLGPYGFVDFYDTVEVHFSHFQRMAQLFLEYGPFSWYPFQGGGVPSFVGQHPPYHPAVLLAAIVPIWLMALLWNILQTALAGWGMARLLRALTGVSREVSLLCGGLFALANISGNVHIVFAYAFPAFAVLTLEAFDPATGRGGRLWRCTALLLLSMISFPVLTLPHFPVFHLALLLFLGRGRADWGRQIAGVFLVWTGYVLLFVPSIASLFLYIPYAQRDWDFPAVSAAKAIGSFLWALRGRLLDLSLFPLLPASIILLRRDGRARVALTLLLVSLMVACIFGSDMKNFLANTFIVKMDLFLSSMVAGTASFLLVSLALDALRRDQGGWRLFWGLSLAACLLRKGEYAVLNGLFVVLAAYATLLLLRPEDSAEGLAKRKLLLLALLAIGLVGNGTMTRQQYIAAGSYAPGAVFGPHAALDALAEEAKSEPFRVGCIDVHPAVVQAHGLDTVGGKSPLFNKYYKEYVQAVVSPQLASPELRQGFGSVWRQVYLTRSKADHDQRPIILSGPERELVAFQVPLLEAMGVRYLVSARPLRGFEGRAELVADSGTGTSAPGWLVGTEFDRLSTLRCFVYRLNGAQGLGRLASPAPLAPEATALASLMAVDPKISRSQALLAEPELRASGLSAAGDSAVPAGLVRLVSWSPDRLVFRVTAQAPALLLVANNHDPRWTASLDGRPVPVLRAEHAFQAVPIAEAGTHEAVLEFHSPLIWWLHLVSLAGVALLFSAVAWQGRAGQGGSLPCSALEFGEPRLAAGPLRCVLAGTFFSAVWALGFHLFVLRKVPKESVHYFSLTYAQWSLPLLGPAIGLWAWLLLRAMAAGRPNAR